MIFYYFVYKPLLPLIRVASTDVSIFNVNQHLFNNVGKLSNYYGSLEKAKLIVQRKEQVINVMRGYYSFLINFNLTRAAFLSEDIDDIIASYKTNNLVIDDKLLENIYKISQSNEHEINLATKFIEMMLLATIKNVPAKVNLYDTLLEAGVKEEIIKNCDATSGFLAKDEINHIKVFVDLNGFFIKELLLKFFSTILEFIASNGNLSQISCTKDDEKIYINFSCLGTGFNGELQELNLFKCNALALANFAKLSINYKENEMQIAVTFFDLDP